MPIPKAVEEAGRVADELHAKAYPKEAPPAADSTPAPQPEVAPAPQPAPPAEDATYWKSRFDVIQGKYNAEVPRLAEQVRSGKEATEKLEAKLAELNKPAPPPEPKVSVPAELIEKYGEEFVQDMKKMIPAPAPVQQAQLPDNIATKADIEELRAREIQRMKRDFFADLEGKAPKWRELNTDAAFLNWLAGVDEFSGRSRQDLFDDAYTSFDVNRVSHFFNSWKGNQRQSGAGQEATPPPIEHQLAPTQNRTTTPPAGKRYWTLPEIDTFYADARKGRFRGKEGEAEFARIEQEIFTAKREGRIKY